MLARIVRIGNSRGLLIPTALLEECGIRETVDLAIERGCLDVCPVQCVRHGWAKAARAMADRGDDRLLDPETPTTFDEANWEW
jgi:antitoxin MazE